MSDLPLLRVRGAQLRVLQLGIQRDHLRGPLVPSRHPVDLPDRAHARDDSADDHGLAVQERELAQSDVELRAIRVLAVVAHAEEARPVVPELEGLVPEQLAVGGHRVQPGAVDQVAGLHPSARLDPVHRVPVELLLLQQGDEVPDQFGALLVEELQVHGLARLVADGDADGAVGAAAVLPRLHARLHAKLLVEDQAGAVLVLEALPSPLHEPLLVREVQDVLVGLRENDGRRRLALVEVVAVSADDELHLLLELRLVEALDDGLHIRPVAGEERRRVLVLLKQGVRVLAVDVQLVVRLRARLPAPRDRHPAGLRRGTAGCCRPTRDGSDEPALRAARALRAKMA
mmetsp:Transcript_127453/g.366592  ORF Transcript_127453/g.366592 Transcript_127453/m.366592 type:complete len:344 (-) Transcript_127453:7-1038(-)